MDRADGCERPVRRGRPIVLDDHPFALCLTHDVDRPYKTYQSVYYAVRDRRPSHLADALPGRNPYWQFEEIATLEDDLGVRSAFYLLNEPHLLEKDPRRWVRPGDWIQHLGRYDVEDPAIVSTIRWLDAGGWEIGLHGSYRSCGDLARLRHEKSVLERCLDGQVVGGRQHYLNLSIPETWRYHAEIGLRYDASLGSGRSYGFEYGYEPLRPFGDEFVVFPLTLMEQALPNPSSNFEDALAACEALLSEAAANGAVMTALWHPRYFSESDFPGYRRLYRRLVERALEMGAWVGSPADCYRELDLDRARVE
jgi:hypothetical protein